MTLEEVYKCISDEGGKVICYPLDAFAISFPNGCIGVSEKDAEQKEVLMHECGHVATGTFYCPFFDRTTRMKYEAIAERWMIFRLIPKDELDELTKDFSMEEWEIAEHFNVSMELARKAISIYKNILNN